MEDVDTVSMPMDLNVIQHKSNDGLVINKQNGISYATYIGKLLGATHAMRPNILCATVMMAQKGWTGVKRILRYLKRTIDFALTCGGHRRIESQSSLFCGVRRNNQSQPSELGCRVKFGCY
jgi:hypothetical protein